MAIMQLTFAASTSVDAVYFAYVYAAAPFDSFSAMTSAVHFAYHFGNVLGSLLGEAWVRAGGGLVPLFYFSFVNVTLALLAFFVLPPPRKSPPSSLASTLRHEGAAAVLATFKELVAPARGHATMDWLCWWVCGFSAHVLASNYYQLQIAAVSLDAPFGILEAAIELALSIGAILASPALLLFRRRQRAALVGGSLLAAALYASCAIGSQAGRLADPLIGNIAVAGLFALQYAVGSVCLASELPSGRYALVFSLYGFIALAAAAIVQGAGAVVSLGANGYYTRHAYLPELPPRYIPAEYS